MCDDNTGGWIFCTGVVLDVPEFCVRRDLLHHLLPMLDRTVQTNEITQIGIDPDTIEADFLDKTNRTVRSTEISILIHFKRQLYAKLLCVATEFANSFNSLVPDSRIVRVLRSVDRPEP